MLRKRKHRKQKRTKVKKRRQKKKRNLTRKERITDRQETIIMMADAMIPAETVRMDVAEITAITVVRADRMDREMTVVETMAAITVVTTAIMENVYSSVLKVPRMVLMVSNRSRKIPVREIKRKTIGIKQADIARVPKRK